MTYEALLEELGLTLEDVDGSNNMDTVTLDEVADLLPRSYMERAE